MSQDTNKGIGKVVKAGFWIYGQALVNNLFGLLYWLIISRIAGSEILGLTSATIGLATLIVSLTNIGIPTGISRFLGREWGRNSREGLRDYFWTGFYILLAVNLAASLILLLIGELNLTIMNYTPKMFLMASLIVFLSIANLIGSYWTSILRTELLFIATLTGNLLKLGLGVGLVMLGYGFVGAVLGYSMITITILAFGLYYVLKTLGGPVQLKTALVKEIIEAGSASWLPSIVMLLGQWLGVVMVFGATGAVSTGYYYVAFTVSNVVLMVGISIIGLLLPYLSALSEGRKRTAWSAFRLSMLAVAPVMFILILYPNVVLELLGHEYTAASNTMRILLLSAPAVLLFATVNNLVYAYGWYRSVLGLGLSQNLPRLIFYFILVPIYGGLGAALSFTLGALASLPFVHIVANKAGFSLRYREIIYDLLVPGVFSGIVYLLNLHWLVGSLMVLFSYIVYARLGLITRSDLKIIAGSFMSDERIRSLYSRLRNLIDFLLPY